MIILEKKTTNTQSKQKEEIINNRNKSIQLRTEKQQGKINETQNLFFEKYIDVQKVLYSDRPLQKKMNMKIINIRKQWRTSINTTNTKKMKKLCPQI